MAKLLYSSNYKNRWHYRLYWSSDWYKRDPWTHDKQLIPYFSKFEQWSDNREARVSFYYIGPLSVVIGKLLV